MTPFIKIVEVGARDGLQNESQPISLEDKVSLIDQLSNTGLSVIEAGAFVSPQWVPQMAQTEEVLKSIQKKNNVSYPVLVPNQFGFDLAVRSGVKEIAIFGSASESFSKKNINCSIQESLERFAPLCLQAQEHDIKIRGYISCVVACPYEGKIDPAAVVLMAEKFLEWGIYEISLGDTIGVAVEQNVDDLLEALIPSTGKDVLALHFHDTFGHALDNIKRGLEYGITIYDSSIAGLGGCPYAKGATGNIATEFVVSLLHEKGYQTGVDIEKLSKIGQWISQKLGKPYQL